MARAFETIAAIDECSTEVSGFTGDAHHALDAIVVGLQIVIGDGPIFDRAVFGKPPGAVFFEQVGTPLEISRVIAVGDAAPVLSRPADTGTRQK